jgi:excisionase family DNA binding protein
MPEKFIVTNYDRNDLISMIKEAFKEELKEILKQQEKPDDYDVLLSRKEVSELLKVSLITISKYQRSGKLPYSRLGRNVYFKKRDIMKALEIPVKYKRKMNI